MSSPSPATPARDLAATLDGLLAVAIAAVGADAAAIYLARSEAGVEDEPSVQLEAARGLPRSALGHVLRVGEGLVGRVVAENRSLVSDDVLVDPRVLKRRADWDQDPPPLAFLGVPLRAGQTVIGAIELLRYRPGPFQVEDRAHAVVLADAAGLLIEQARLASQTPRNQVADEASAGREPIGLALVDESLRVTMADATFCHLFGQTVDTVVGRSALAVVPALGTRRSRDLVEAALHGTPGQIGGVHAMGSDGVEETLSLALVPVEGRAPGRFRLLIAVQDLTERARLEAELRAQNAEVGAARDRLHAVVEVVSHELRTPLTSVLGYAHLLHERPDASLERRQHWVDLILEKARLMARLVDEVTDLSRLGSARFALNRTAVDLGELLQRVVDDQVLLSGKHDVYLQIEPGLPEVPVDPGRIEQVVTNLVTNAVKYWPEGGTVFVRLTGVRGPASKVSALRLAVEDSGPGIPPEVAPHIFEAFYRGPDDVSRAVPGTGLGLAVSRGIVEAHGGRIWHEPVPGGGARFVVELPISS